MNQQVIKTDRDRWHPNGCNCLHPPWDCPVQSLGVLGPPDGGLLLFHHPQYDRVRWRGAMSRSGVLGQSGQAHHVRPLSPVWSHSYFHVFQSVGRRGSGQSQKVWSMDWTVKKRRKLIIAAPLYNVLVNSPFVNVGFTKHSFSRLTCLFRLLEPLSLYLISKYLYLLF